MISLKNTQTRNLKMKTVLTISFRAKTLSRMNGHAQKLKNIIKCNEKIPCLITFLRVFLVVQRKFIKKDANSRVH